MDQCLSELVTFLETKARLSGRLAPLELKNASAIKVQETSDAGTYHRYRAFGLNISSEMQLPELPMAEGPADIIIRLASSLYTDSRPVGNWFWMNQNRIFISYEEEGDFLLEDNTVTIRIPEGLDERVVRRFLLGRILALVLHERGHLLLHGSAIAIDGVAVILLGQSGSGKSTLAAALNQRGHHLLTDDLAVMSCFRGAASPLLIPAFPQIKLCPDAARHLCGEKHELELIDPWVGKFELLAPAFPTACSFPVRKIFLLKDGTYTEQRHITGCEATTAIVHHLYPSHLPIIRAQDIASALVERCSELSASSSVAVLTRPRLHSALVHTCRFIERSMARG